MTSADGSSSLAFFSFNVVRALNRYERAGAESGGVGGTGDSTAPRLGAFVVATVVQAGGNCAMAASAGLLGQALVGRQLVAPLALVDSLSWVFSPLTLCLVGATAAVVKAGAGAIAIYAQKRAAFRVGDALRQEVADSFLSSAGRGPANAAPPQVPAELHATIAIRLRDVERGVDEGLLGGARAIATLVPLAGTLVVLSWRLAVGALVALGAFGLVLRRLRGRERAGHARASQLAESLHANVDELVSHLDLWRTFGAEDRVRKALSAAGEAVGVAAARAETSRALSSGGNEVAAALALLAVVTLVERGALTLGEGPLVAFAAVFFLMYRPLRDLGDAQSFVDRGALALRIILALGVARPPRLAVAKPPARSWTQARLRVLGLSVRHGDRATPPTTLEVDPGDFVAVVGETGAGKTSLLRALLGLEPDVTGAIRYGNEDLGAAGVGPNERPFAWVPQEPAIVAGTLAANVALGSRASEGAAYETARQALAAIGARSLVGREGDVLSAGGPELSGGERQWIAIARALATGLPVLLLDEPTAGLDPPSQQRVLDALAALRGKRTILIVTHRPEPLTLASRVVRLEWPVRAERSTFSAASEARLGD